MNAPSVPIVPPRERGGTERPEKGVYTHPFRPQTVPLTHLENMWLRNHLVQNRSSRSTKSFHGTVVWNGWSTTVPAKCRGWDGLWQAPDNAPSAPRCSWALLLACRQHGSAKRGRERTTPYI